MWGAWGILGFYNVLINQGDISETAITINNGGWGVRNVRSEALRQLLRESTSKQYML